MENVEHSSRISGERKTGIQERIRYTQAVADYVIAGPDLWENYCNNRIKDIKRIIDVRLTHFYRLYSNASETEKVELAEKFYFLLCSNTVQFESLESDDYKDKEGIMTALLDTVYSLFAYEQEMPYKGPWNSLSEKYTFQKAQGDSFRNTIKSDPFFSILLSDKLEYCLFLYYDQCINRGDYEEISEEFKKLLESDLRPDKYKKDDQVAVGLESTKLKGNKAVDEKRKRANLERNRVRLRDGRLPKVTTPDYLISTYINAVSSVKGRLPRYLEWKLRVDTTWRLYYVITRYLPFQYIFPNKNPNQVKKIKDQNRNLNKRVKKIVSIIASVQDNYIRENLIDVLQNNLGIINEYSDQSIDDALDQLIKSFSMYVAFNARWEELRSNIFNCIEYQELLKAMMDSVAWSDRAADQASIYKSSIKPLTDAVLEWEKSSGYPNKPGTFIEIKLFALFNKDQQASDSDLFTKIWKLCFKHR